MYFDWISSVLNFTFIKIFPTVRPLCLTKKSYSPLIYQPVQSIDSIASWYLGAQNLNVFPNLLSEQFLFKAQTKICCIGFRNYLGGFYINIFLVSFNNDYVQNIFILLEIWRRKRSHRCCFLVSPSTGLVFLLPSVSSIMSDVAFSVNLPMNKYLVNNHFVSHCLTVLAGLRLSLYMLIN